MSKEYLNPYKREFDENEYFWFLINSDIGNEIVVKNMEKYENSQFIIWGNDNKANQLEKNLEDSIKKLKIDNPKLYLLIKF